MKITLLEKLKEALQAALPIGIIIIILHFTIVPMPFYTLVLMLMGLFMLVIGLTLFSLGTEMAMMPMGEHIGSSLFKSRNLALVVIILFIFGTVVTAAEPDLSVFAGQVASIPDMRLIFGIAVGVGVFLVLATLRILFRKKLNRFLIVAYGAVFLLSFFSMDYLAVGFDASAVTTGPITVPFLLAVGAGFTAISASKDAADDNFGICGICSIGPIIAVLILGLFSDPSNDDYQMVVETAESGRQAAEIFVKGLWETLGEVLLVVLPIFVIFIIFQIRKLKLSRTELIKIMVGLLYLLVGLTIFLTGVNKGFMPAAKYLGESMGSLEYNWILPIVCLFIGACVVVAEPAVHVLNKQVEDITDGAVSRKMMLVGMMLGVGLAFSLAMLRLLLKIPFWAIIVPAYIVSLTLSFFVPKIFVGIAYDSGGVAAGAMSAAFVLPFTIGVCTSIGGNIITEAFGVVGLIASIPPITVQLMGVIYNAKLKKAARIAQSEQEQDASETESIEEA